jgi:hypothetical protein
MSKRNVMQTGVLPTGTLTLVPSNDEVVQLTHAEIARANVAFRNAWYGNVCQELNRKAALLLAEGKISQEEHDAIVDENGKQAYRG